MSHHVRTATVTACAAVLVTSLSACGGDEADSGEAQAAASGYTATPIAGKGKTYSVKVTGITDPAKASAAWGGDDGHYVALDLSLSQTDPQVSSGSVNSSCFSATTTGGADAQVMAGYTANGKTPIQGTMSRGGNAVEGQLVVKLPEDQRLKTLTARCDGDSSDTVTLEVS